MEENTENLISLSENNTNSAAQKPRSFGLLAVRAVNILLCLFAALVLILYANFGKIASHFINVETIKNVVNKNTSLIFEFDKPQIYTTKDLCVTLKSKEIKFISPDDKNETLLYIKDADVKIKILPLIFKKLEFKKLASSDFELNVKRYKDGKFNFQKYIKKKSEFPFKLKAQNAQILIDKYLITFLDDFNGTNAEISGGGLVSTEFDLDKGAEVKTKGEIKLTGKNKTQISPFAFDIKLKFPINKNLDFKDYRLEGGISNLDLSLLHPYIIEFISSDIKDFKGIGTLKILPKEDAKLSKNPLEFSLDLENLLINIYKNNHNNYIDIPSKSKITLTTSFKKDIIFVDDFKFLKPGTGRIDIGAFGTIKNLSDIKSLNPDITFTITNSSLHEMLKATPDYLIKMQQDYIPNLKKYNANALVNAKFTVKDRLRYPNMYGYINLDDVYILERPSNVKTSSGKCLFEGSKVKIDVNANLPPSGQKLIVKGETEIKELPHSEFNITSTPFTDLEFAHKILIPIHEIFGFQLGPLPFMKIAGNGEISLKTKGTRDEADLNGYFRTKNGSASLDGLNIRLNNGNLNLLFQGKKIIFNNTTGTAEGAKVQIDGNSTVDGSLDLYVKVFDVNAKKALNVVKTSPMILNLLNGGSFLNAYTNPEGNIDYSMRLWGKVSEFSDMQTMQPSDDLKAKGTITFKNNKVDIFPEIKASNVKGTLDFTDFVTLNLNADIYTSPFNITGSVTPDTKASKNPSNQPQIVDLTFKSKNIKSKDLYRFFYDNQEGFNSKNKISKELYDFLNKINFKFASSIRMKGKVNPDDEILDMKKFTLEGWASGMNYKGSDVLFNSGEVKFKNQEIIFKDLNTVLWAANVITSGSVDKIFDDNFIPKLNFKLVSFPFAKVPDFAALASGSSNTPDERVKKALSDFSNLSGTLNGEFSYDTSGFSGSTNLDTISFYDKKRDMPVKINSGGMKFSNNTVKLNAINLSYGTTPVFIDALASDFNSKKPLFNVYLSTNLNEESLDKLLNPMLQFPLKTKGEFTLKGRLRGWPDNYTIFSTATINPGADLYYMGANLGDVSNKREITARLDFKNDEINIKNTSYSKYILSQNKKETPYKMLKLSGGIKTKGDNLLLDNIAVQTPNPAPARLLNIAFKKSVLKQGTFDADILMNGPVNKPNAKGKVKFSNVDIPVFESKIRDVDLTLNDDVINAVFEGEGMGSDVKLTASIVNKPDLPVIINEAEIVSKTINLNKFTDGLSNFSKIQKSTDPAAKQAAVLSPRDLVVKKGKFLADEIYFNNIKAYNFSGDYSHTKDSVFIFDNVKFNIAGGTIKSSGRYEFNTTKFAINSEIENCDANTLVSDILGTKNQIYGKTNGKISLEGSELNTAQGINTMRGEVDFAIYDGKMPKLGSLEYLLRAGNLLKSGILGFTINNVIEVLIPYKTGEFKKISGDFIVQDGKIDNLNIYSKGDNLSIYTTGNYDIATSTGDFEVFGKLSTKISNLLGPVGNASVNSIVNFFAGDKLKKSVKDTYVEYLDKIPDIAGSSTDFRLFAVKILGDLNTDNFVKSFNWLN